MAEAPTTPGPVPASMKAGDVDLDAGAHKSAMQKTSKVDECRALIDRTLGTSDTEWWRVPERQARDPELAKCCAELALVNDAGWVDNTQDVRTAGCCRVSFPAAGAACTPWGPPVPPPMLT